MKIDDIRSLDPGATLSVDICVVGSGPVGLTIAAELSGSGLQVVVLESGGRDPDDWADALGAIESVGAGRVMDQTLVRNRGFGGTSRTWSGRVAALDAIDFRQRDWVDGSGWPIQRDELVRYLPRTLRHLGSPFPDNTAAEFKRAVLGKECGRFDPDKFIDYLWCCSRDASRPRDFMRFGPRAAADAALDATALLHATLTHIDTTDNGRAVTGLEIKGPDGLCRRVLARATILCAGGIENARILLASNRRVPGGVGNSCDQVGRYLMDHPRGPVASFAARDFDRARVVFSSFRPRIGGGRAVVARGVALSEASQARLRLLNAAAGLNGSISDDDPLASFADLARRRGQPLGHARRIAANAHRLAGAAKRLMGNRSPIRRLNGLDLDCIVEQPPRAESRVMLADAVDALGVPLSRIDWRVGEAEARTVRILARMFREEAGRLGLPVPTLHDWVVDDDAPFALPDVAHPMGTTRMSEDPRSGVVDTTCAVHGVAGLYVAGGSVFPTSGHANPTQTALALAIRLADHVRREFAAAERGLSRRSAESPRAEPLSPGGDEAKKSRARSPAE